MYVRLRQIGVAIVASTAFALGWGGLAWACTAQPSILAVSPLAAPESSSTGATPGAGTAVIVRGDAVASQAPVEIRWNAATGPTIGVATSDDTGAFVAPATIPDVPAGIYYVVATIDGVGLSRMAYEVTDAGATASSPTGQAASAWAQAPSPTGSGPKVMLGVGLMAVGLVALFAGFTVVAVRARPGRGSSVGSRPVQDARF